jgi:hypothetical protein
VYLHTFAGVQGLKKILVTLTVLGILLTTFYTTTLEAASFSSDLKQFAWFYKPPYDTSLDTLAKSFDNYTLTKGDEKTRDSLRSKGVDTPFLQYLRADAIEDPGSCSSTPARNQVAYKAGDFCNISKYHSDWFLLDINGKKMYDSEHYVMMDPGSSGWRTFFRDRAKALQENSGWNGVFLDNVEGSLGKRKQMSQMPKRYTSDSSYQDAIKGFLSYIYSNYFKSSGRPLMANIISLRSYSVWFSYLNYLNGAMDEAWAVGWHNDYQSTTDWLADLDMASKTQSYGKRAILISQGDKSNSTIQQFTYASYLLIANGKASFRYAKKFYYRYAWLYSNYSKDLGTPLGSKYKSGDDYCRDFSKGKVCVNPSSHSSKISTF